MRQRTSMARVVERVLETPDAIVQVFEQHDAERRYYRVQTDRNALVFSHRPHRFVLGKEEVVAEHQSRRGSKQTGRHAAEPGCCHCRRHKKQEWKTVILYAEKPIT